MKRHIDEMANKPKPEPPMLLMVMRVKPTKGRPYWEKDMLKILGLDGPVIWPMTCDFQQCGILTSVDSDVPVQPPVKLRNSKYCLVCSLGIIEYSSDKQRLWSDCVYAQADLRLCWSYIPHFWKSYVTAHFFYQLPLILTVLLHVAW